MAALAWSSPQGRSSISSIRRAGHTCTTVKSSEEPVSLPSIIVAAKDGLRQTLARGLEVQGYQVFEAENEAEALHIVIGQSRPINILLADTELDGHNLARTLQPYRPEMQALFVSADPQDLSGSLNPESALLKVREALKLPVWAARIRRAAASA